MCRKNETNIFITVVCNRKGSLGSLREIENVKKFCLLPSGVQQFQGGFRWLKLESSVDRW